MDIWLDHDRAKKFNCAECDIGLQSLRNCLGKYKDAKTMILNDKPYKQCPRSMTFNQHKMNRLVSIYFNCRRDKVWPHNVDMSGSTAFCLDVFEHLDIMSQEFQRKLEKKHKAEMDRKNKKNDSASKVRSKR